MARKSRAHSTVEEWMWRNRFPLSEDIVINGVEYSTDGYVIILEDHGEFNFGYSVSGLDGDLAEELRKRKLKELVTALGSRGLASDFEWRGLNR